MPRKPRWKVRRENEERAVRAALPAHVRVAVDRAAADGAGVLYGSPSDPHVSVHGAVGDEAAVLLALATFSHEAPQGHLPASWTWPPAPPRPLPVLGVDRIDWHDLPPRFRLVAARAEQAGAVVERYGYGLPFGSEPHLYAWINVFADALPADVEAALREARFWHTRNDAAIPHSRTSPWPAAHRWEGYVVLGDYARGRGERAGISAELGRRLDAAAGALAPG